MKGLCLKITHGFVESSAPPVIQVTHRATRSSSNNSIKYVIRKCKTTTYQQSFFVRTCRIWNRLVDVLHFNTDSLSVFKSVLLKYYHQSLELNYDPDNPRTFKTICLKCNSVHSSAVHRSRRAGAGAGVLTYFAGAGAGAGVCSPPVKL